MWAMGGFEKGKTCNICGKNIRKGSEFEFVFTERGDLNFFHTKCLKMEQMQGSRIIKDKIG